MNKLGNVKFKGKLSYKLNCSCKCTAFNFKKINQLKLNAIDYNLMVTEYDRSYEYPSLQKLFNYDIQIHCDHPVGEDVIFYKNSFYGYASDWMNYLDFATKSNFKFYSHEQVKNFYFEYNCY